MRILFATDGSIAADRARYLLDGIRLPAGSYIRVAGVRKHRSSPLTSWAFSPGTAMAASSALVGEARGSTAVAPAPAEDHLSLLLDFTVAALEAPERRVDRVLLDGHPGSAIVDEAKAMSADLVVVGNRGHGTIESMLMGSVSRHVASHAPCSILIARTERVGSVLFATDGSDDAHRAEVALATWPMFRGATVTVVAVAQTATPTAIGGVPALYDQVMEQYDEDVDKARLEASAEAEGAARRLTDAGLAATAEVREGDPAGEIVRAAHDHASDLIVTGTHGRTGLTRMVMGSVAGNVAAHATASVLIVRDPRP
jgi:nucleotide-binding universal stress UspA family protein